MTNMWKTAFVEELEDNNWYVSRPNEFQNNEIYIEAGPFASETEARAWLNDAWRGFEQSQVNERYWASLAENARM